MEGPSPVAFAPVCRRQSGLRPLAVALLTSTRIDRSSSRRSGVSTGVSERPGLWFSPFGSKIVLTGKMTVRSDGPLTGNSVSRLEAISLYRLRAKLLSRPPGSPARGGGPGNDAPGPSPFPRLPLVSPSHQRGIKRVEFLPIPTSVSPPSSGSASSLAENP